MKEERTWGEQKTVEKWGGDEREGRGVGILQTLAVSFLFFFFLNKERKRLLRRLDWLIASDPADLIFLSEPRGRTAPKFPALAIRTILTFNTESNKFCKQYRFFAHETSETRVPDLT